METASDEPRLSRPRLQLFVVAALLIACLLGMHALVGGPTAAAASMTSSGHASLSSHGMIGAPTAAPVLTASGAHGTVHGSGGCADAMSAFGVVQAEVVVGGSGVGTACPATAEGYRLDSGNCDKFFGHLAYQGIG